jgi:polar amino acid transport system substrate-binding protein
MAGLVGVSSIVGTKAYAQASLGAGAAPASSTMAQVKQNGVLRMAGIVGQPPGFIKDLASGEWSGAYVEMGRSLAGELDVKLEIVETTWGNAVLDLQSNKIDLAFGLSATPKRALSIQFTPPLFRSPLGTIGRTGFDAANWTDIDTPETKIAVEIGTSEEAILRQMFTKAQILTFKNFNDAMLSVQTGRNDVAVTSMFRSLGARQKMPDQLDVRFLKPFIGSTVAIGFRYDEDRTFREFLEAWRVFNQTNGTIHRWMANSLPAINLTPADLPEEVEFR